MINIEVLDDRIRVDAPFRYKDVVKSVPGSKWDPHARMWTTPLTWAACKQLRGLFGDQLEIGPRLVAWSANEFQTRVNVCLDLRSVLELPEGHPGHERVDKLEAGGDVRLMPFQRTAAVFLANAENALIGDEMGTGKTPTVIRALQLLEHQTGTRGPVLVVCPSSVKINWQRELAKWAPEFSTVVITGSATKRREQIALVRDGDADVAVINWDLLKSHSRLSGYGSVRLTDAQREQKELDEVNWHVVVADEAHKAKNPKAQQTRALWNLGQIANHRIAMTGTPIANNVGDLWGLMHFVDPEEWSTKSKFLDRYALMSFNPYGGLDIVGVKPQTHEEFNAVFHPRFIRRTKAAVLRFLPEKQYSTRSIEWTPKQKATYKKLAKSMIVELGEEGALIAKNPLELSLRLIQLSSAMLEETVDGGYVMAEPSNKVDAMMDIIDEHADEPLVFFAEHKMLIDLASARLTKKGIEHSLVVGGQSEKERQQHIDDFQNGVNSVILCTAAAGGVGITLTKASTLVFLQRPWSLIDNKQAEDRVHRIGQAAEHVNIITLVTQGSIEWHRMNVLDGKEVQLQEVVQDVETLKMLLASL